jgi:hypothetical protein
VLEGGALHAFLAQAREIDRGNRGCPDGDDADERQEEVEPQALTEEGEERRRDQAGDQQGQRKARTEDAEAAGGAAKEQAAKQEKARARKHSGSAPGDGPAREDAIDHRGLTLDPGDLTAEW